jgi:small-conductance mechanosensitive channel
MATGWLDKLVGASPQHGETTYVVAADQSCRVPADQRLRAALTEAHEALAASRENEDRLRLLVDQARDYLSDAKHRIQAAETRAEALQAELDELRASNRQGSAPFVTMDGYEAELKKLRALLDGAASCSGPGLKANGAG